MTEYSVGDKVVYPRHGAGTIVEIERKDVLGRQREYLVIKILHSDMTALIPVDNAERAGLRKVIAAESVEEVLEVLRDDPDKMPVQWQDRSKFNQRKIGTGDVFDVAEVVRDLAVREAQRGLPLGEKQMFSKAKKILASELMYARDLDEDEAAAFLEDALGDIRAGGEATAADVAEPERVL